MTHAFSTFFSFLKRHLALTLSLLILVSVLLFLTFSSRGSSGQAASADFDTFSETLFKESITASTINLHYTLANPASYDIADYPITLGSISKSSRDKSLSELENTKKALSAFSFDALSLPNQMTYDILTDYIDNELSVSSLYYYDELLRSSTGTQAELPILLAEYSFRNEKDVTDYLSLLGELDTYFTGIAEFEQEKSDAGLFMPAFACDDIIKQCDEFLNAKDDHYLLKTFSSRMDAASFLSEEQKTNYKKLNETMFIEHVLPAYEILKNTMSTLNGTESNEMGLSYLPDGKAYYEYLIRCYTGTDTTVPALMEQVKKKRSEDLSQISALLTKDPTLASSCNSYSFAGGSPADMLSSLKTSILADFPEPVETTFTVKYVDDALADFLAPAFYLTAPMDDISQNCIYINPKSNYTKVKLFTTLAHEGYPGHLYQTIMTASYGIPAIRSILNYPGYTEGWATYVEMLSYQYSGLNKELANILQLNQSVILSLYSTADFGIHYEGWSFDDTLSFFAGYGIDDKETIRDIFNLIVEEPGHYQKYYIGYLQFLQLKEQAKSLMGEKYSDKLFHEMVLRMGPAPFTVLAKYMPQMLSSLSS